MLPMVERLDRSMLVNAVHYWNALYNPLSATVVRLERSTEVIPVVENAVDIPYTPIVVTLERLLQLANIDYSACSPIVTRFDRSMLVNAVQLTHPYPKP